MRHFCQPNIQRQPFSHRFLCFGVFAYSISNIRLFHVTSTHFNHQYVYAHRERAESVLMVEVSIRNNYFQLWLFLIAYRSYHYAIIQTGSWLEWNFRRCSLYKTGSLREWNFRRSERYYAMQWHESQGSRAPASLSLVITFQLPLGVGIVPYIKRVLFSSDTFDVGKVLRNAMAWDQGSRAASSLSLSSILSKIEYY